jgi:hypothetical protein
MLYGRQANRDGFRQILFALLAFRRYRKDQVAGAPVRSNAL